MIQGTGTLQCRSLIKLLSGHRPTQAVLTSKVMLIGRPAASRTAGLIHTAYLLVPRGIGVQPRVVAWSAAVRANCHHFTTGYEGLAHAQGR